MYHTGDIVDTYCCSLDMMESVQQHKTPGADRSGSNQGDLLQRLVNFGLMNAGNRDEAQGHISHRPHMSTHVRTLNDAALD